MRAPTSPSRIQTQAPLHTSRLRVALWVMSVFQVSLLTVTLLSPWWWRALMPAAVGETMSGTEQAVIAFAQLLALFGTGMVLWRASLVARYRPTPDVGDAALPPLTVVVPAYNEGEQILATLRSLAKSDYPQDRLQLIAVDDGSVDDTWEWMCRARAELGDRVTTFRCRTNRGKKHAVAEGVRRAWGEVLVTVDSDSEVLPDTLRLLVAPLVVEPACAAVAGNVRVLNQDAGPLPKMMEASFTAAFDFGRAAESQTGAVLCCPGALSAFRTELLCGVLAEWLGQTFFGRPASIGEDRALTNLMLRSGGTVRYQSTAVVLTRVPETFRVLSRMLLRWGRSNVRETLVLARFVGRLPRAVKLMFVGSVVSTVVPALAFIPSVGLMLGTPPLLLASLLLAPLFALPAAVVVWAVRDLRVALWSLGWGFYGALATGWIPLWAILTMNQGGWLTRAIAPAPTPIPLRHARQDELAVASPQRLSA